RAPGRWWCWTGPRTSTARVRAWSTRSSCWWRTGPASAKLTPASGGTRNLFSSARDTRLWHASREQPRARYLAQAQRMNSLDGGRGRCRALAAYHLDPGSGPVPQQHRHLAAQPVQVWLDDLEDEARRGRGVERVASPLEH